MSATSVTSATSVVSASRRRAAVRLLSVVAFGSLALTGCGEGKEPADPTDPTAVAASTGKTPWAGTKQFVTVDKAWAEGGLTYLSVRPAEKKVNTQFDTWEIIPGTGPFTTVTMTKDARVLLACPVRDEVAGTSRAEPLPYSPTRFVTLLNQMDSGLQDGIGYDLVFDGAGQVTSLKSLYRP